MLKKIKDHGARKFFFLFFIVFFLFVLEEVAYSQSIRLLIPNGGETWIIGQEKDISWISNGLSADTKVKLELFRNRRRIGTIASNRSIKPGEAVAWKWKVGEYQGGMAPFGSGYKVCITTLDEPYRYDCSDLFFRLLVTGSIIVTNPSSETVWYNENTYNITWEGGALSPYLNISLLDQHGRFIRRLFSTVFNDGTQPWKVPKDIPQGIYIILIQTQAGFGYKSEPFKIVRVFKKRPPDFKKKEPEELPIVKWRLPDFKIRDVRHNYRHKKVVVYFVGGVGKYKGPLVFNVRVSDSHGNNIIQRRNMVRRDNTIEDFALDLKWPSPQTPYLNVSVKINPDCQIKELNCNNNLYDGRIFENSTDFKLLGGQCSPRKSIWWPKDREICDRAWFNWTEGDVKNAIQRGELRYYDPYDPDVNVLLGKAKVWIGNFSREEGTARVRFRYIAHDGARTAEHQVRLAPGARNFVESGIMLNLQRDNFIEVSIDSRSSVQRARINIRFHGLPYDLE